MTKKKSNVLLMGAGGREFHNFLIYFKDNPAFHVVCFTAAQIPGIEKRRFPKELAGRLYKDDIPIFHEDKLPDLIRRFKVDWVFLSYSDLSHEEVMRKSSLALAHGANFCLLGPKDTMIQSRKPVVSVCAVRTGAGKSQTTRKIAKILREKAKRVVIVRHPMPYGNLLEQRIQRFETLEDLKRYHTTIEEREEYETHIENGFVVYAGVDYKGILNKAEKEADIILWDGGNNDFSFYKSDLNIVVADSHRPGHELRFYPGFVNLLLADVIIINKVNTAKRGDAAVVEDNVRKYNPKAVVIRADSEILVDKPNLLRGKNALVIEDGPTLTHGGMSKGAGTFAAKKYGAKIIDARKYALGSIRDTYDEYRHLKKVLPAMGYSRKQIKELEKTIERAECEVVVDASPANLSSVLKVKKPIVNVSYELGDGETARLEKLLNRFLGKIKK